LKPLTRKQAAVLEQLVGGMKICQIASQNGMDESSVNTHLSRAKAKLGAKTTFQAVAIFAEEKIKGSI
jgi:DNA-binding CsgD family transcriptional regulator